MPGFGDPFTGLSLDRPLSKEELIRSVRFMIAAEFEAIEMYTRVAEATSDEKIKKLILDIADEEKVHVGEFGEILLTLDPKEKEHIEEGLNEAKDILKKSSLADKIRNLGSSL